MKADGESVDSMAFMQQQITDKRIWIEIGGNNGLTFVPMDVLTKDEFNLVTLTTSNVSMHELNNVFGKYYEGTVRRINLKVGFGVRLSAPGYMDCTDWCVFDTVEEAQAYLDETYPEDEDED